MEEKSLLPQKDCNFKIQFPRMTAELPENTEINGFCGKRNITDWVKITYYFICTIFLLFGFNFVSFKLNNLITLIFQLNSIFTHQKTI